MEKYKTKKKEKHKAVIRKEDKYESCSQHDITYWHKDNSSYNAVCYQRSNSSQ